MILIRSLEAQDRDILHRLIRERGTFNEGEIRVAMELIDDTLSGRDPDYHIYCAHLYDHQLVPSRLLGYICFGPIPLTERCYDLYWIVVDQRHGRQGVGKKLLQYMEEGLREKGARQIHVDTSSTPKYHAARAFYERNGYEPVCTLSDFYQKGDDKLIFVKRLS